MLSLKRSLYAFWVTPPLTFLNDLISQVSKLLLLHLDDILPDWLSHLARCHTRIQYNHQVQGVYRVIIRECNESQYFCAYTHWHGAKTCARASCLVRALNHLVCMCCVCAQIFIIFLSNSSLNCKLSSTLSSTEKELTLFSHVSTLPRQPLHIALATQTLT